MSKFLVEFEMDNAAFDEDVTLEVEAVLDRVKQSFRREWGANPSVNCSGKVRDSNGNTVGMWRSEH